RASRGRVLQRSGEEARRENDGSLRLVIFDVSCPAKAGHPVSTIASNPRSSSAITGSSACADDDNAGGACPLRPSSGHGLYPPATTKENAGEDGGSGGDRCWLDRRLARGHLVAHG